MLIFHGDHIRIDLDSPSQYWRLRGWMWSHSKHTFCEYWTVFGICIQRF